MSTPSDRELLERAAKAAGYEVARESDTGRGLLLIGVQHVWNPLDDDGDALRLAVKLRLNVSFDAPLFVRVQDGNCWWTDEDIGDDINAATRRAIVRAAASLSDSPQ